MFNHKHSLTTSSITCKHLFTSLTYLKLFCTFRFPLVHVFESFNLQVVITSSENYLKSWLQYQKINISVKHKIIELPAYFLQMKFNHALWEEAEQNWMRIHEIWLQSNYLFFFLYYGGALCQFVEGLLTYLSLLKFKKNQWIFFYIIYFYFKVFKEQPVALVHFGTMRRPHVKVG